MMLIDHTACDIDIQKILFTLHVPACVKKLHILVASIPDPTPSPRRWSAMVVPSSGADLSSTASRHCRKACSGSRSSNACVSVDTVYTVQSSLVLLKLCVQRLRRRRCECLHGRRAIRRMESSHDVVAGRCSTVNALSRVSKSPVQCVQRLSRLRKRRTSLRPHRRCSNPVGPSLIPPSAPPVRRCHVLLRPQPDLAHVALLALPGGLQVRVLLGAVVLRLEVPERGEADEEHEAGGDDAELFVGRVLVRWQVGDRVGDHARR